MMPLLLRIWKATLSRLESSLLLSRALFSRPTSEPRSLKDEVLELIRPWRHSRDKPPFTTGELIVLMLVVGGTRMHLEDVEIQILSTFDYYNQQTVRAHARGRCMEANRECEDDIEILPDFHDSVKELEHPSCIGKFERHFPGHIEFTRWTFSATTSAARLYLRNRLEPARKGVFPFMRLPAELREKIYKMLLIYPKSGLALAKVDHWDGYCEKHRLGVPTLDETENPNYGLGYKRFADNSITVGSPTDILNVLRVSKRIRHEALPIFYGRNSFHFDSLPLLIRALRVMTEDTAQQIQDLRIFVGYEGALQDNALQEFNRLILKLSPKTIVLIVHSGAFWNFCGGDEGYASNWKTSPAPAEMHKLEGSDGLGGLVTLAKSVEHLRIVGNGFLKAWLEEKTEKSEMRQIDVAGGSATPVGTVCSSHQQLPQDVVTKNA